MRAVRALLLVLLLTPLVQARPNLETELQGFCTASGIQQASLALVGRDQTTRYYAWGKASQRSQFVLGSCSKSFTALAIAQLVAAGKLSLDDPVQKVLPWFRLATPQATEGVTIRHLLSQTAGLPVRHDFGSGSLEAATRALAEAPLSGPPGEKFVYSNINYTVLGLVVETISGQPYAEYIQTHILQPLGMNLSQVGLMQGRPVTSPTFIPAGGVVSTAEDMALYLRAYLGLSGTSVVPTQPPVLKRLLPGIEYGFGWFCDNSGSYLNHSGIVVAGFGNYRTYMSLRPPQGLGVVVLAHLSPKADQPDWHKLEPALYRELGGR